MIFYDDLVRNAYNRTLWRNATQEEQIIVSCRFWNSQSAYAWRHSNALSLFPKTLSLQAMWCIVCTDSLTEGFV